MAKRSIVDLGIDTVELATGLPISGSFFLKSSVVLNNVRCVLYAMNCYSYSVKTGSTTTTITASLNPGYTDLTTSDLTNCREIILNWGLAGEEKRTINTITFSTDLVITVSTPFSSPSPGDTITLVWKHIGPPSINHTYPTFANTANIWDRYISENFILPSITQVIDMGYEFDNSAWVSGSETIELKSLILTKGSRINYNYPAVQDTISPKLTLLSSANEFEYINSITPPAETIIFDINKENLTSPITWVIKDSTGASLTPVTDYLTLNTNPDSGATLAASDFDTITNNEIITVEVSCQGLLSYVIINKVIPEVAEPTIPPGLKFGGAGEFTFTNNTNFSGGAENGTVQIITAGEYLHPDGVVRTVPTTNEVITTYTDTTYPPTGIFFIIYSDDTTVSNFFGQDFGTLIYDSATNVYTLVKTGSTQAFTPDEETVIIAIGKRINGDTGIGSIASLVSWRYNVRPGEIDAGAIDSNTAFANTIRPIEIVDALPGLPNSLYPAGCLVYLNSDGKVYRNSSVTPLGWTKAVDGGDIVADSIVAGKIAAGAIGADEIAANAITAKHLVIADLTNLVPDDGDFESQSTTSWDGNPTDFSIASTEPKFGTYHAVMTADGTANGNYKAEYIPVEPGQQYYCSVWYKTTAGFTASGEIYPFIVEWSDENKTNKTWTIPVSTTSTPVATYTQGTGTVTVPAGKYYMRPGMSTRPTALTGDMYVDGMVMRRVNGGELIVDGAITSSKLDTALVYAGAIQLDVPGHIYSGKTTSDSTAAGFWLGTETGPDPAFHVGDATSYLKYTTADGINIRGPLYTSGKTSISDPTAGVFMGDDGSGGYDFAVGTTSEGIAWDASAGTFTIYGNIVGTGNLQLNSVTQTKFGVGITERLFSEMFETFTASTTEVDPTTEWFLQNDNGERSIITDTEATSGGKALQTGDAGGTSDRVWAVHRKRIPFDPNITYRIKFRVRRSSGVGTVYCGWTGFTANGQTKVSYTGVNTYGSAHYHCAQAQNPGSTYTEYTGYTKGWGAVNGTTGFGTLASPGQMHPDVRYISPLFITNYSAESGITIIDSILVDIVADDTLVSSVSADKITAGTISSNITHTGQIILSTNGNLYTSGKSTYASTTPGVFLGYDATEGDYVLNIGKDTDYVKWNGTQLTVKGDVRLGDYSYASATQGVLLCRADTVRNSTLDSSTYTIAKRFKVTRDGTIAGYGEFRMSSVGNGVVQPGAYKWQDSTNNEGSYQDIAGGAGTCSTTTYVANTKSLTLRTGVTNVRLLLRDGVYTTGAESVDTPTLVQNCRLYTGSVTGEAVLQD